MKYGGRDCTSNLYGGRQCKNNVQQKRIFFDQIVYSNNWHHERRVLASPNKPYALVFIIAANIYYFLPIFFWFFVFFNFLQMVFVCYMCSRT